MYPKLENRVNIPHRIVLDFLKEIKIPRIENERLLADCIRTNTKS